MLNHLNNQTKSTNALYQAEKEFYKADRLSDVDDEGISAFDLLYE